MKWKLAETRTKTETEYFAIGRHHWLVKKMKGYFYLGKNMKFIGHFKRLKDAKQVAELIERG